MAFAGYSVTTQRFQTAATTHTVTLPDAPAGNLILLFAGWPGDAPPSTPAGWTVLKSHGDSGFAWGLLLAKVSSGSEPPVDITLPANDVMAAMIYEVWNWGGTVGTDVIAGHRATSGSDSSTADVTAGWGADDNLAIGMVSVGDDNADITAYPTSMTDPQIIKTDTGGNNSIVIAGATEQITTASYTLTQFVFSEGESYCAVAILVKPGASGVDPNAGPSLTITEATLTPGGTISGAYSNYATIPTTLTVSDGTNTITIPTPTIVDNGTGGGTFSGTMPALPTTGTASLVLFGDVTVELS